MPGRYVALQENHANGRIKASHTPVAPPQQKIRRKQVRTRAIRGH